MLPHQCRFYFQVQKNAKVNEVFYKMSATDPDTNDPSALKYNFDEPITAVDKYGKEVTDSAGSFKVLITSIIILR